MDGGRGGFRFLKKKISTEPGFHEFINYSAAPDDGRLPPASHLSSRR
jgi:hypothetical protein